MAQRFVRWMVLLAAGLVVLVVPAPRGQISPEERIIQLSASQFSFSPGTIIVNPGDRVTMEVRSTDVVHGLYLDGYDISVTANPGQVARLSFVADRSGAFRFRCSVPCGDIHPFMIGRLQVGPNWLLWRAVALVLVAATWSLFLGIPAARAARIGQAWLP